MAITQQCFFKAFFISPQTLVTAIFLANGVDEEIIKRINHATSNNKFGRIPDAEFDFLSKVYSNVKTCENIIHLDVKSNNPTRKEQRELDDVISYFKSVTDELDNIVRENGMLQNLFVLQKRTYPLNEISLYRPRNNQYFNAFTTMRPSRYIDFKAAELAIKTTINLQRYFPNFSPLEELKKDLYTVVGV